LTPSCEAINVTAIPLGRASLHGSVPPTRQLVRSCTSNDADAAAPFTPAYLVLLRAEIARFTQCGTFALH